MWGKLITFEGGEGSGKSTQIELLKSFLIEQGLVCTILREPGGVKISEEIRSIILDKSNTNMDALTELLLFVAARRQLVAEVIKPRLENGEWIICDRFIDSTTVYQGIVRGIGLALTERLNKLAVCEVYPELTIVLDIEAEKGLERAGSRGEMSRLDLEDLEFHKKVRMGYRELILHNPKRLYRVDGDRDVDKIFDEIRTIVKMKLLTKGGNK